MTGLDADRQEPPESDAATEDRLRRRIAELEAELGRRSETDGVVREARDRQKARAEEVTVELVETAEQLAQEKEERIQTEHVLEETEEDLRGKVQLLDLAHDTIIANDMDRHITFWNRGAEETYGWSKQEAVGKVSHTLLQTEFPGPLVKLTAELIREGRWEGELVHTARDGQRIVVESRWVLRRDDGGDPAAILEIDRDVTERQQAERRSEADRKRLFSVLNLLPGYVVLKDRHYAIRYANQGFLEAFSEPGGKTCYAVQCGRNEPCRDCPISRVLDRKKPEHWERTFPNGRAYRLWAHPFVDADGTELMLELGIDVTDRRKLERLLAEASEAERRRFGRDLHDTLGQKLTGVGYLVGALGEEYVKGSPGDLSLAEQIVEAVNECVADVRAMSRGLDPVGLEEDGLANALEGLAEDVRAMSEIACRFQCDQPVVLTEGVATHVYRIAQEAVNNAMKHAGASEISIALSCGDEEEVVLTVMDNGTGIGGSAQQAEGMGMRVMRYRADAIDGKLTVRAREGGGTAVACAFPKPEASQRKGDAHE